MISLLLIFGIMTVFYIPAQGALLPLYALYFGISEKNWDVEFKYKIHVFLIFISLGLPMLFLLKIFYEYGFSEAWLRPFLTIRPKMELPGLHVPVRTVSIFPVYFTLGCMSLTGILYFFVRLIRQKRLESRIIGESARSISVGRVTLVVSDFIQTPFSVGLFAYRVYIPSRLLQYPGRLKIILEHEAIHIREHHFPVAVLMHLNRCMFWYNPLAHLLCSKGKQVSEYICDRKLTRKYSPYEYSKVLLEEAQHYLDCRKVPMAHQFYFSGKSITARIQYIIGDQSRKTNPFLVVVICVLLLWVMLHLGYALVCLSI